MGRHYIKAEAIRERTKLIKKMLKEGRKLKGIYMGLRKMAKGKYKASQATIQRDIKKIVIERDNWQKMHNPHQLEDAENEKQRAVDDLEVLIVNAKESNQFKTAGDLIIKKCNLLGIGKGEKEKEEKTNTEEKYEHRTEKEIAEILFKEFRILAATLQRMAKRKDLNNIIAITVRIIRSEENKNKKYIITDYAEEKHLVSEQRWVGQPKEKIENIEKEDKIKEIKKEVEDTL